MIHISKYFFYPLGKSLLNLEDPRGLFSFRYNAHRGNAEEDQALIRLAHGLIARSQRPDPRLLQSESPSTTLPARLIDVGLDNLQFPRLVNTAGQTGCYVALSHCWSSQETRLTISNMRKFQQRIEPLEMGRQVSDAIELTRSLGLRYIWIDVLCVVQDDVEDRLNAMSRLPDIYRSAIITFAPSGTNDETVDNCIDSSVLEQPFKVFLDWSRPTVAKSCSDRLFTPHNFSRTWKIAEKPFGRAWLVPGKYFSKLVFVFEEKNTRLYRGDPKNKSDTPHEAIPQSNRLHNAQAIQVETKTSDTLFEEANHEIDQGAHNVEAGEIFKAVAFFMKARELVSAFKPLTLMSWKIHAVASANIALVYQMQRLPVMALDIAQMSLALQSKFSNLDCNSTLE